MLTEYQDNFIDYVKSANAKGESYCTELVFMALIFGQQKMIRGLIEKLLYFSDRHNIHNIKKD
jgi:hypothetical protein